MELHLDGFAGKVEYAQLLNDASEVLMQKRPEWQQGLGELNRQTLTLRLPVQKPNVTVPVIELFMKDSDVVIGKSCAPSPPAPLPILGEGGLTRE